jgi:integrase
MHDELVEKKRWISNRSFLHALSHCMILPGPEAQQLQIREERCVIADLVGKGKHIRTVPVPHWAKRAVDEWITAAGINGGTIFRRVSRLDKIWGDKITPKAIWHVVKAAAKRADIKNLAPHDLRRTCARLCHLAGGELEQIQFLLDTHRFKQPSGISAASRNSAKP